MKLMIMGYAGHGKDTVCDILKTEYGFSFKSSSEYAAEKVIMPYMASIGHPYNSVEECMLDKHNHRVIWFNAISEYNRGNPARLIGEVLDQVDIYCGVRCVREFEAARKQNLFDFSVWVDRLEHLPEESTDSCTVRPGYASYRLDNNSHIDDLYCRIDMMMSLFRMIKARSR